MPDRDISGAMPPWRRRAVVVSYPKGSSRVPTDLNRDVFREALGHLGLRPVTQVSVDDVWSALRFRPVAEVGSREVGEGQRRTPPPAAR